MKIFLYLTAVLVSLSFIGCKPKQATQSEQPISSVTISSDAYAKLIATNQNLTDKNKNLAVEIALSEAKLAAANQDLTDRDKKLSAGDAAVKNAGSMLGSQASSIASSMEESFREGAIRGADIEHQYPGSFTKGSENGTLDNLVKIVYDASDTKTRVDKLRAAITDYNSR